MKKHVLKQLYEKTRIKSIQIIISLHFIVNCKLK